MLSLLEAIGSVDENRGGKAAITLPSNAEFLDPPAHKDIDAQTVVDLRRILSSAGYGPQAKRAKKTDRNQQRPG